MKSLCTPLFLAAQIALCTSGQSASAQVVPFNKITAAYQGPEYRAKKAAFLNGLLEKVRITAMLIDDDLRTGKRSRPELDANISYRLGEPARAEQAFMDLCQREFDDCPKQIAGQNASINLNHRHPEWHVSNLAIIMAIHEVVNQSITYTSDISQFSDLPKTSQGNEPPFPTGTQGKKVIVDFWTIPVNGKGDCEDYALTAKELAQMAGFHPSSVLLLILHTKQEFNDSKGRHIEESLHANAVFKVRTADQIDAKEVYLVVDNMTPVSVWQLGKDPDNVVRSQFRVQDIRELAALRELSVVQTTLSQITGLAVKPVLFPLNLAGQVSKKDDVWRTLVIDERNPHPMPPLLDSPFSYYPGPRQ